MKSYPFLNTFLTTISYTIYWVLSSCDTMVMPLNIVSLSCCHHLVFQWQGSIWTTNSSNYGTTIAISYIQGFSALLWLFLSLNCCSSVTEKDEVETWRIQKASHNPTMNGLPKFISGHCDFLHYLPPPMQVVRPTMQTHVNLQRVTESVH